MTIDQITDAYADELENWIAEYDDCEGDIFIGGSKYWNKY